MKTTMKIFFFALIPLLTSTGCYTIVDFGSVPTSSTISENEYTTPESVIIIDSPPPPPPIIIVTLPTATQASAPSENTHRDNGVQHRRSESTTTADSHRAIRTGR